VADQPGDYLVSLVVYDGFEESIPNNITITVLTRQDKATENLTTFMDVVNHLTAPEAVFVNRNMQNALTNKINAVLKLIDQGNYAAALDKLETDILPKTDGCAVDGAPHKNDWIKDCATQQQVYPFILRTIEMLRGLN
jgi:hypothetical protein